MATNAEFEVTEVGVFKPNLVNVDSLEVGQVGFLLQQSKMLKTHVSGIQLLMPINPAAEALPGYRKATPMVFCGLYPVENSDYDNLRDALEKLQLNDASLVFEPETYSSAWIWFSLWLFRSAAYGCYQGTSGA